MKRKVRDDQVCRQTPGYPLGPFPVHGGGEVLLRGAREQLFLVCLAQTTRSQEKSLPHQKALVLLTCSRKKVKEKENSQTCSVFIHLPTSTVFVSKYKIYHFNSISINIIQYTSLKKFFKKIKS